MKRTKIDTTVPGEFDLERSDLEVTIPLLLKQIGSTASARAGGDPVTELAITQGLQSDLIPKALQSVEGRLKESGGFAAGKAGQAARTQKNLRLMEQAREMESSEWESTKKKRLASAAISAGATLGAKTLEDWDAVKEKFGGLDTSMAMPWNIGPGDISEDQINIWRDEYFGLPPKEGTAARAANRSTYLEAPDMKLVPDQLSFRPEPSEGFKGMPSLQWPTGDQEPGWIDEIAAQPERVGVEKPTPFGTPRLSEPTLPLGGSAEPPPEPIEDYRWWSPPQPEPLGTPRLREPTLPWNEPVPLGDQDPGWIDRIAAEPPQPEPLTGKYDLSNLTSEEQVELKEFSERLTKEGPSETKKDQLLTDAEWKRLGVLLEKAPLREAAEPPPEPVDDYGHRPSPRYRHGPLDMPPVDDEATWQKHLKPSPQADKRFGREIFKALDEEHFTEADRAGLNIIIEKALSGESISAEDRSWLTTLLRDNATMPPEVKETITEAVDNSTVHEPIPVREKLWIRSIIEKGVEERVEEPVETGRRERRDTLLPKDFEPRWGPRDREATSLVNNFAADKNLLASFLDLPLAGSLIDSDPSALTHEVLQDPEAMMSLYADPQRRALLSNEESENIEHLLMRMA